MDLTRPRRCGFTRVGRLLARWLTAAMGSLSRAWKLLNGRLRREAAKGGPFIAPPSATAARVRLERTLRAARAILWECDLQSGIVRHEVPVEHFATGLLCSPCSIRAALRLVDPKDRRDVLTRVKRAVERREPYIQHFRIVAGAEREALWVEDHGAVVWDDTGRVLRLESVLIDITAHKRAEQALVVADRRKDEFLATVAHELRSPLTAIAAAAQLVGTTALDAAQLNQCAALIRRQAAHQARLVEDLLDISRMICNRLDLRRGPLDLRSLLRSVAECHQELFRTHRHQLQLGLPEKPLELEADEVRLMQLFGNLLTNAAKYTPDGGVITVSAERTDSWTTVRVRDSGIGIAPEDMPHVFETFWQAGASRAHAPGGLGIGLSLVRRIAQLHGGVVTAYSEGPGRGSEFTVRLPLSTETQKRDPLTSPVLGAPIGNGQALRILVADDNADVAEVIALSLRLCGHEVHVALDGEEALSLADRVLPHVALLDVGMPKLAGDKVALEIRKRPWAVQRGIMLVALSGWSTGELQRTCDMSGFDQELVKPADIDAVNRLIETTRGRRSRST